MIAAILALGWVLAAPAHAGPAFTAPGLVPAPAVAPAVALAEGTAQGMAVQATWPDPDSVRAHLVASVEEALGWVGAAEAALVTGSPLEGTPLAERDLAADRARLLGLLDRLAGSGHGAGPELERLRALHPEAVILVRTHALWHLAQGEPEGAAPLLMGLLERRPRDAAVHLGWAEVLLHRGERDEARIAMARALELDPGNEGLFRSLVVLHDEAGTLPELAERLARLRLLHPDQAVLVERERELAHRIARARGPGGEGG